MTINPNAHVRLFIPDEDRATKVISFIDLASAYAAMRGHNVLKVGVDGLGAMSPEAFTDYCIKHNLDRPGADGQSPRA